MLIALLETMPPEEVCETLGACHKGPLHDAILSKPPPTALSAGVARMLSDIGTIKAAQTCATPGVRAQLLREPAGALRALDPPSEECQVCRVRSSRMLLLLVSALSEQNEIPTVICVDDRSNVSHLHTIAPRLGAST
jgi:hypothetical protein